MKKLFLLISILVLCLGICNATLAATTLSDIKGTKYEDAVENLVEVGLVNGYEDDTYRPNVTVTRAQMAKMMVIALGEEDKVESAKKAATSFTDMKSSHWAYGYINVAKDLGIINGYTDGSFGPDETVSYAEATTMAVRALGYEVEIEKSKEVWPNNYINYAKKISLYDSMGSFVANSGAKRGDTAIILWNMLRTGVCTAISQSNSGITYGEGQKMINKYKNYVYMEKAAITSVSFEEDYENANVIIEDENEKLKLSMSDTDVLEFFGRSLELLYDSKNKKLVSIEGEKLYTEKEGEVTNVTSSKIYIDGYAYTLPDENDIVLYKVEELSEAIDATLFISDSKIKYILASGAKKVEIGIVTDTDIEVNDKEGIKIRKINANTKSSYALIDEDDMPEEYSVIVYYLNDDGKIGILAEFTAEDATTITSHSSTKMKVAAETFTYDPDAHEVIAVTNATAKTLAFKSIDKNTDLVYVYEKFGKIYFIVFCDAVEDEEAKEEAYESLKKYIEDVAYKAEREATYSQVSYAKFIKELDDARAIKSSDSTTKINSALTALKEANTALTTVSSSSTEGKIAKKRAELRSLINGSAANVVKNKVKYTTSSYSIFLSRLEDANDLLERTDTTLTEVTNIYTALADCIDDDLVLITNTQSYKNALAALNAALDRCKNVSGKSSYVESTYNTYKSAYDNAILVKNKTNKTEDDLKTAADRLNSAIDNLAPAMDSAKDELNALIVECIDYIEAEDDYMPNTFTAFETAYNNARKLVDSNNLDEVKAGLNNLKSTKKGLKLIDTVLADSVKAVEKIKTATNVSEALEMDAKTSQDKLNKINGITEAVKEDLEDLIVKANKIAANQGISGDGSINIAIGNTKKVLNSDSATLTQLVNAYVSLDTLVKKED